MGTGYFKSLKELIRPKLFPIISLYALLYVFRFAINLLGIPKVRLIEHAVCQRYYLPHPLAVGGAEYSVPDRQCKIVPIQAEVAVITGWRMSLDAIPSVLKVTFYGKLADQIGRKPVLLLVCLGDLFALVWSVLVCMSTFYLLPPGKTGRSTIRMIHLLIPILRCYLEKWLPVRLVWTSSIFLLIGAGDCMFAVLIVTMIADGTQYSQRSMLTI